MRLRGCGWRLPFRPSFGAELHVRFSNRPVGVKRFQTIHRFSVDVARGLVLLSGIGTKRPLYGAFFVKEFARSTHLFPSSVSWFDLNVRFFAPTRV